MNCLHAMLLAAVCLACIHHHQAMSLMMSKRFLLPYGFGYYCDCNSDEVLTNKFCRYDCPWLDRKGPKRVSGKRSTGLVEVLMNEGGVISPYCDCNAFDEDLWRNPRCWKVCRQM